MSNAFRKFFKLPARMIRSQPEKGNPPTIRQKISNLKQNIAPPEMELKEFGHLIKSETNLFLKVCVLSGITSGILMAFPYALKGITELAGLRNNKEEQKTEADQTKIKAEDSNGNAEAAVDKTSESKTQNKVAEESKQQPPKKRGVFDFFTLLKEVKPEVRDAYLKFVFTWFPIFLLSGSLVYFRRLHAGDIANRIAYRLRYRLYSHLISRDLSFFVNHKSASTDYVHKLSNDITNISYSITVDLQFLLRSFIFAIGSTSYILINSPELALLSTLIAGGLAFGTKKTNAKLREAKIRETEQLTNLSIVAGERLSNMKLIKVNNTEEAEKKHYLRTLDKFYHESYQVSKYTAYNFGILDGLGQSSVIAILTYGSFLVTMGVASSEMLAFSIYAMYAGMGFRGIFNSLTELKKSAGLYKGIYDIIGSVKDDKIFQMKFEEFNKLTESEGKSGSIDTSACLQHPPRIEFKNVYFNYFDSRILTDLSFEIEPGTVVAVTGGSGSGKTTILNLLTKLFDPDAGSILIDGRDITELDPMWVRMNVSYVTQEPILFMGTIIDNIRYGNDDFDTSYENCVRAAKLANAHDFISAMADGYESRIGEKGMTLSGGQRQRIVIARALIKNPKILIMDESTSSLDPKSEKIIVDSLSDVVKERTCIIVTHKLEAYERIITKNITLKSALREVVDVSPEQEAKPNMSN